MKVKLIYKNTYMYKSEHENIQKKLNTFGFETRLLDYKNKPKTHVWCHVQNTELRCIQISLRSWTQCK